MMNGQIHNFLWCCDIPPTQPHLGVPSYRPLEIVGEGLQFNLGASSWFPRKLCTEVQGCSPTTTQTRLRGENALIVRGEYITAINGPVQYSTCVVVTSQPGIGV